MRWGDRLEFVAEAGPGDFIFVPPYVPHQEINARRTSPWSACWCAPKRVGRVVNLQIDGSRAAGVRVPGWTRFIGGPEYGNPAARSA